MFEIKIDASEFERKTADMGAAFDQMPFAMSRALNDAVTETRQHFIDITWPSHVTMRNASFLGWALKMEFSTKDNLTVAIYDQSENRGRLAMHADGGTKLPHSGHLAIPTDAVKLGASGVRANMKPMALANKVVKGNGIYQWQGRGKNRRLVLMYVLATSAKIKPTVPFREDFNTVMRASMTASFPRRMMEAMATRR